MKKIYLLYIVLISLATTSLIGCSDWTESEAKTFPESIVSDEYYAALRAYKQTDHQVAFGWFGGWSGEGAFMKSSLAGIPDSVDIVSIWDNGTNLSEAQRKDMAFCQNMKGTKIMATPSTFLRMSFRRVQLKCSSLTPKGLIIKLLPTSPK